MTEITSMRHCQIVILLTLALSLILTACGRDAGEARKPTTLTVVATLFPLYDFTRNVVGNKAHVILLLPPGVEPHAFEPRPSDIKTINESQVFIHTGLAMEPWVASFMKLDEKRDLIIVDASTGITLRQGTAGHRHTFRKEDQLNASNERHAREADPHIWLDFHNAALMVDTIAGALAAKDPANRELYLTNAQSYKARLDALDKKFIAELGPCPVKLFIHGGHYAFGYLAGRYGLTYLSAYEGSPNSEPTPRRIIELKRLMEEHRLKHVYYEELITPRMAETLAKETGATLLKLHGAHNLTREELKGGVTFIDLMNRNLENLKIGLQCP
jgi:zinc transport system substrate-binding protein